jgi:hypothetical protein
VIALLRYETAILLEVLGAACLLAVTWTASVLAATRREHGSGSA